MKRILAFLVLLFLAAFGLGFAVLNAGNVQLNYYFGQVSLPLALLVVGALITGALLGLLTASGLLWSQRHETARLRKRLSVVDAEIRNLREMPVRDRH